MSYFSKMACIFIFYLHFHLATYAFCFKFFNLLYLYKPMSFVVALNHDVVMLICITALYLVHCCHGVDNVRIRSACIKLSLLFDVVYDVF